MANETTTGAPLTATVGEQLGEKGHLEHVQEREKELAAPGGRKAGGRSTGERGERHPRGFPWAALAGAAAGYLLLSSLGRGVGRRLRRLRKR